MVESISLRFQTVGHALFTAGRYRPFVRSRFDTRFDMTADSCTIHFDIQSQTTLPVNVEFACEVMLASLKRQLEDLTRHSVTPTLIELPYDKPKYHECYRTIFNCPIKFRCSGIRLHLSHALLMEPLPLANVMAREQILMACDSDIQRLQQSLENDWAWRVRMQLSREDCLTWSCEQMAEYFHTSARSLRRYLKESDVTFKQLSSEAKMQFACRLLEQNELPIAEIQQRCGYRDGSSFREVFMAWAGVTPLKYQRGYQRGCQRGTRG